MTFSDKIWDRLAAFITPLVIASTAVVQPLRRKCVNEEDRYYTAPEPEREWEEMANCPSCETETWHLVVVWNDGLPSIECTDCGSVSDYELQD